ncbi:hypothetical protein [Erwinia phage vB_Ea277G]|nr:hypothetical protein [Erwinia phage vB_Ea277G]
MTTEFFRGIYGAGDVLDKRLASWTFSNHRPTAHYYAIHPLDALGQVENPRIVVATLDCKNFFQNTPTDPFLELGEVEAKLGRTEALRIARKFKEWIANTNLWEDMTVSEFAQYPNHTIDQWLDRYPDRLEELYFQAYPFYDDPEEVTKLIAAGFDGAAYGGNAASMYTTEWRVFAKETIKIVRVEQIIPQEETK